jgi:group I intron endonuclease
METNEKKETLNQKILDLIKEYPTDGFCPNLTDIGIYSIKSPTNKIYIGQSKKLKERIPHYRRETCQNQRKLFNSIKKHGWNSHSYNVLICLKNGVYQNWIDYFEQFFIDYYRNIGIELLNLREGGLRGNMSDEAKTKLSVIMSGKNNPFYGKKHSSKTRSILSQKAIGRPSPFKGRTLTVEARQKLSLCRLGRFRLEKNARARAVIQLDLNGKFIKEWACIKSAALALGMSSGSNITTFCSGKRKMNHVGGYKWRYL